MIVTIQLNYIEKAFEIYSSIFHTDGDNKRQEFQGKNHAACCCDS
jgi:hypothetical protein